MNILLQLLNLPAVLHEPVIYKRITTAQPDGNCIYEGENIFFLKEEARPIFFLPNYVECTFKTPNPPKIIDFQALFP